MVRREGFRHILSKLPLIDSRDYLGQLDTFHPSSGTSEPILKVYSSGTTGCTKTFDYDARALFVALAHGQRQRHVLARRRLDVFWLSVLITDTIGGIFARRKSLLSFFAAARSTLHDLCQVRNRHRQQQEGKGSEPILEWNTLFSRWSP